MILAAAGEKKYKNQFNSQWKQLYTFDLTNDGRKNVRTD